MAKWKSEQDLKTIMEELRKEVNPPPYSYTNVLLERLENKLYSFFNRYQ
jgi:hypothetical protein